MTWRLAAGLAAMLVAACSGDSAPLVATNVVVTEARAGTTMRAGYLELTNTTRDELLITGVKSSQFAKVEMHESTLDNGISRMRAVDQIAIAPGQTIEFKPGGLHLMLMQPRGATDAIALQFFAGDVPVLTVNAAIGS